MVIENTRIYFTDDVARRIFNDLSEDEKGELPFWEHKVRYRIGSRNQANQPEKVSIDVYDENGNKVDDCLMTFSGTYSSYHILD